MLGKPFLRVRIIKQRKKLLTGEMTWVTSEIFKSRKNKLDRECGWVFKDLLRSFPALFSLVFCVLAVVLGNTSSA